MAANKKPHLKGGGLFDMNRKFNSL